MSSEEVKRSRSPFGRRRARKPDPEVELKAQVAEQRAIAAETRMGDLQNQLVFYGDAIKSLRGELESMTERIVTRVAPQVVELEVRNAETEAMREAVESLRTEVDAEREILVGWRREMDAAVTSLQSDIDLARRAIDEMPERIRETLTPAAKAMQAAGAGMAVLAGMSMPASPLAEAQVPEWPGRAEAEAEWPEPEAEPAPAAVSPEALSDHLWDDNGYVAGNGYGQGNGNGHSEPATEAETEAEPATEAEDDYDLFGSGLPGQDIYSDGSSFDPVS